MWIDIDLYLPSDERPILIYLWSKRESSYFIRTGFFSPYFNSWQLTRGITECDDIDFSDIEIEAWMEMVNEPIQSPKFGKYYAKEAIQEIVCESI